MCYTHGARAAFSGGLAYAYLTGATSHQAVQAGCVAGTAHAFTTTASQPLESIAVSDYAATVSSGRGSIPERIRRALFALSRGRCYAPGCREPVVVVEQDEPVFVGEVAHIIAAVAGGPRGSGPLPDREIFSNLLLLCGRHHKIVDNPHTRSNYPANTLRKWKRDREQQLDSTTLAELDALGPIAEHLPTLLVQSLKETTAQLSGIVGRLEDAGRIGHDAAALFRDAVERMPELDPDLHHAAQLLANFADEVPNFSHSAFQLYQFGADGHAFQVFQAAEVLKEYTGGQMYWLKETVDELKQVAGQLPSPDELRAAAVAPLATPPQPRWSPPPYEPDEEAPPDGFDIGFMAKVVGAVGVASLIIGAIIVFAIMRHGESSAAHTRQICTGSSIPPKFTVVQQVKVHGTPTPSPYICATWYPPPISRPRGR